MADDGLHTSHPGETGPGEDEELPQPHRVLSGPRGRWLRRALAAGAVAAAGTAVIVTAAGHGTGGPASPSASPTPFGLNVATDFVTEPPVSVGSRPRVAIRPARCPGDTQCVTAHTVSDSVRQAVADAFPGATITVARTVYLHVEHYGDALTGLDVRARRGQQQITMRLRGVSSMSASSLAATPSGSVMLFNGFRIQRYEAALVQYRVLVEVVSPADEHSDLEPLVQLAQDGRLLGM